MYKITLYDENCNPISDGTVSIKTFVWLPIKTVDEKYMIVELTARDLEILMADIPGESG